MCTVSFSPNSLGFHLLMNRDEKRNRPTALPPAIEEFGDHRAIFPREPSGGAWIAANDAGVCLALINWHRIESEPALKTISRGCIVPELAGKLRSADIARGLTELQLNQLRPFRLIGIVPKEKAVTEWRWDLERLSEHKHAWTSLHWFSSGYDEGKAESVRQRVFEKRPANTVEDLRRLHRSHVPKRGPFSICMHRTDAATVSYTEVAVKNRRGIFGYGAGP